MNLLRKLVSHELISGSFYIFLGSMVSNVLAFLLNLYLARSLSYADYAIFASLLSVITLASIPANSINTIIVKFAASYFVRKENKKLKNLYMLFLKFISGFSLSVFIIFSVFAVPFKNFLHIDNILYIVLIGLVISSFYLNTLNVAFLQSIMRFRFISFVTALSGIIKLIFGVALVILGYKAFAGLWSIFFMTLGSFFVGFIPLLKILRQKNAHEDKLSLQMNKMLIYAIPTFIAILFLTSFTSIDVILVKHFFSPRLAGFYAGLSLMGKVIFYFTSPIPMVMFPILVKRHTTGKNFINLFFIALILVILPSIAITVFYFIFPTFAIKLFLGGREYLYISKYLGIFGLYLTVFSLVNVCVNFFLSLSRTKIMIPVVGAAVLQIALIFIYHSDFYQVIGVSLAVLFVLLLFLFFMFLRSFGNLNKFKENLSFLNAPSI